MPSTHNPMRRQPSLSRRATHSNSANWMRTGNTMKPRFGLPQKRSLTLKGHRTSVSLEDPFWEAFQGIAREDGKPVNALAAEIDAARGLNCGLAGAIRLFVLDRYMSSGPPT